MVSYPWQAAKYHIAGCSLPSQREGRRELEGQKKENFSGKIKDNFISDRINFPSDTEVSSEVYLKVNYHLLHATSLLIRCIKFQSIQIHSATSHWHRLKINSISAACLI